jgi:hypothetical protein
MQYKGKIYGRIGRKQFPLEVTAEQVDALAYWARDLLDEQNGPPLVRHEETWQRAVDNLEIALEPFEANNSITGG